MNNYIKRNKKHTKNIVVNINGKDYDLGKICTIKSSYCENNHKNNLHIKCNFTNKVFDNTKDYSIHITKYLLDNEKIKLTPKDI